MYNRLPDISMHKGKKFERYGKKKTALGKNPSGKKRFNIFMKSENVNFSDGGMSVES